ncbi:MAG: hypothetical protein OIN66_11135 [Candidatus Methanoperedens sp.]|nr:hypothetical protein [Candidatus Methanoperedens sp.]
MDILDGFEEITADMQRSEIKVPLMHVELSFSVRYFLSRTGVGYCGLLISGVKGKGLRGKVEAVAAKSFIGRTVFVFLSELDDGKKLVTVPALFEKDPTFDEKFDLDDFIINTYFHADFKKTVQEVYQEHMCALVGKKVSGDRERLYSGILELPAKGIEILRSYR